MEPLGNVDFFKSKREDRKGRRWEFKRSRANSYLIVIAGKDTEPLYFQAVAGRIREEVGGRIDIMEMPLSDNGSIKEVLARAEETVGKANVLYQHICIVFGRDDFADPDDFYKAIREVEKKGYTAVWNNQSFEYWLYLHFDYSDAVLSREDWIEKLKVIFQVRGITSGEYRKDNPQIYIPISERSSLNMAYENACTLMNKFSGDAPGQDAPRLTVHFLIRDLLRYIPEEIKIEETASEAPEAEEKQDSSAEQSDPAQKQDAAKEDPSSESDEAKEQSDSAREQLGAEETDTAAKAAADSGSKK